MCIGVSRPSASPLPEVLEKLAKRIFRRDGVLSICEKPCLRRLHDAVQEMRSDEERNYEERVRVVEDADFTPLIMSSSGGMGVEMQMALKHLSEKTKQPYSKVIGGMRMASFLFS